MKKAGRKRPANSKNNGLSRSKESPAIITQDGIALVDILRAAVNIDEGTDRPHNTDITTVPFEMVSPVMIRTTSVNKTE